MVNLIIGSLFSLAIDTVVCYVQDDWNTVDKKMNLKYESEDGSDDKLIKFERPHLKFDFIGKIVKFVYIHLL